MSASYGPKRVLFDISLSVGEKEIVAIIGPNGAGKTTTLRSIIGIHSQREGEIVFDLPHVLPWDSPRMGTVPFTKIFKSRGRVSGKKQNHTGGGRR